MKSHFTERRHLNLSHLNGPDLFQTESPIKDFSAVLSLPFLTETKAQEGREEKRIGEEILEKFLTYLGFGFFERFSSSTTYSCRDPIRIALAFMITFFFDL